VNRGTSWNNNAANSRAANRNNNEPGIRNNNLGFRPAPAPPAPDWMIQMDGTGQRPSPAPVVGECNPSHRAMVGFPDGSRRLPVAFFPNLAIRTGFGNDSCLKHNSFCHESPISALTTLRDVLVKRAEARGEYKSIDSEARIELNR